MSASLYRQLAGFAKIGLAPGEQRRLTLPLDRQAALSYWSSERGAGFQRGSEADRGRCLVARYSARRSLTSMISAPGGDGTALWKVPATALTDRTPDQTGSSSDRIPPASQGWIRRGRPNTRGESEPSAPRVADQVRAASRAGAPMAQTRPGVRTSTPIQAAGGYGSSILLVRCGRSSAVTGTSQKRPPSPLWRADHGSQPEPNIARRGTDLAASLPAPARLAAPPGDRVATSAEVWPGARPMAKPASWAGWRWRAGDSAPPRSRSATDVADSDATCGRRRGPGGKVTIDRTSVTTRSRTRERGLGPDDVVPTVANEDALAVVGQPRRCRGSGRAGRVFALGSAGKVTGRRPPGSASPSRIAAGLTRRDTRSRARLPSHQHRCRGGQDNDGARGAGPQRRSACPAAQGRSSAGPSWLGPHLVPGHDNHSWPRPRPRRVLVASGVIQARRSRIGPFGPARVLIATARLLPARKSTWARSARQPATGCVCAKAAAKARDLGPIQAEARAPAGLPWCCGISPTGARPRRSRPRRQAAAHCHSERAGTANRMVGAKSAGRRKRGGGCGRRPLDTDRVDRTPRPPSPARPDTAAGVIGCGHTRAGPAAGDPGHWPDQHEQRRFARERQGFRPNCAAAPVRRSRSRGPGPGGRPRPALDALVPACSSPARSMVLGVQPVEQSLGHVLAPGWRVCAIMGAAPHFHVEPGQEGRQGRRGWHPVRDHPTVKPSSSRRSRSSGVGFWHAGTPLTAW